MIKRHLAFLAALMLAAATASASQEPVKYIGADGEEKEVYSYTVLQGGTMTTNGTQIFVTGECTNNLSGTYVAIGETNVVTLDLVGDVNLILTDGAKLNIISEASDFAIEGVNYTLNIYAQSGGSGCMAIYLDGTYGDGVKVKSFNHYGGQLFVCGSKNALIAESITLGGQYISLSQSYNGPIINITASDPEGSIKIADGMTITDGEHTYSGTLNAEQVNNITTSQFMYKQLATISGISISTDAEGKTTATFNGNNDDEIYIGGGEGFILHIDNVVYTRTFDANVPATIMLPFSFDASNFTFGRLCTVSEVEPDDKGVWTATLADQTGLIYANRPFIFVPYGAISEMTFKNVIIFPTNAQTNGTGDWVLHGVYSKKTWQSDGVKEYGFAGEKVDEDNIKVGDFVRVAAGAWCNPMRAYLEYTGTTDPRLAKSAIDLPDVIKVVFPDSNNDDTDPAEIITPVSAPAAASDAKVWSANRTIFIESQPGTEYTIVDLSGRVIKIGATHSTREQITLSATGIVIVKIGKQSFKIKY